MKVTPYTALDLFKYTALITHSDKLTTLKAKEELIRKVHDTFGTGKSTNKPIEEFVLNYKVYTYLLDIIYPDSINKLPKFLTEKKDSVGSAILYSMIKRGATFEEMVDTFQYTNKLYFKTASIKELVTLNLIVKEGTLPAKLLLDYTNHQIVSGIAESTSAPTDNNVVVPSIKSGDWLFDTYNAQSTPACRTIIALLVQRRLLPSNLHFTYWDGLIDELPAESKAEAVALINTYNEEIALSTSYINKQHKDT